jgi:thioredoxin reductase
VTPRIVVAGGGPAGLAAAAAAGHAGASVLLLEERAEAGGQLRYRVGPAGIVAGGAAVEHTLSAANRLQDVAIASGVTIWTRAVVAGWFPGNELLVVEDSRATRIAADALIVATGSTDLPYPFPGATYPGVFSATGLKILLNVHRVRPGRRFAVIGGGDEAEEIISDLVVAGGEVVWSGIAPASFLRVEGEEGVTALVVGQERYEVDVVAIAVGRQPDAALAAMAGVPLGFAAELGGYTPQVDDRMCGVDRGVFVAGDAAGTGSVSAAIEEGRLAGLAAAGSLGLVEEATVPAAIAARGPELRWRAAVRASLEPVFAQPYE